MHKLLCALLLGVVLVLSGCSSEKADVQAYLDTVDAYQETTQTIAKEMAESMTGLGPQVADGTLDPDVVKSKLEEFEKRMVAAGDKVAGIPVPEKAKEHHSMLLEHHDLVLKILQKTPAIIDLTKQIIDIRAKYKEAGSEPKDMAKMLAEIKPVTDETRVHQEEVAVWAQKGQAMERELKEKRKALAESVGIPVEEKSPAPAASSAAATPAAPPAPAATPATK